MQKHYTCRKQELGYAIQITFDKALVFCTICWVVARAVASYRKGHIDWRRELTLLPLFLYGLVLVRVLVFQANRVDGAIRPLVFIWETDAAPRIFLDPFRGLALLPNIRPHRLQAMALNAALFVPLGFLLPFTFPKLARFGRTLAVGTLVSVGFELFQLLLAPRVTDTEDILMNAIGTAIGFGIYLLVLRLFPKTSALAVEPLSRKRIV